MGTRSAENSVARHLRAFDRRLEYLGEQIAEEPHRAAFYAEEIRALEWLRDLASERCQCKPPKDGDLPTPCWHCRTHGVLEARRQLDAKKVAIAKVRKIAASSQDPVAQEILVIVGYVVPSEGDRVG